MKEENELENVLENLHNRIESLESIVKTLTKGLFKLSNEIDPSNEKRKIGLEIIEMLEELEK